MFYLHYVCSKKKKVPVKEHREREDRMNIRKFVRMLQSVGNGDDFDTYFVNLQDKKSCCGPTKEEARRDYTAMIDLRQVR